MVWLPLLLEILGNMFIVNICYPVCDDIIFKINLNSVVKPFSNMSRKVGTKS